MDDLAPPARRFAMPPPTNRTLTLVQEYAWRERVREEERAHRRLEAEMARQAKLASARTEARRAAGQRAPTPPTTLAWAEATLHGPRVKRVASEKTLHALQERKRHPQPAALRGITPRNDVSSLTASRSGESLKSAYDPPSWRQNSRSSTPTGYNPAHRLEARASMPDLYRPLHNDWETTLYMARVMKNPQALRSAAPTPWR